MGHAYHTGKSNEEVVKKVEMRLNKVTDLSITWEEFMRANEIATYKYFLKLSDTVMKRQNSLLAHLFRADDTDAMKAVTLKDDKAFEYGWRRVGRPRQKWVNTNMRYYWNNTREETYEETPEQINEIIKDAIERKF